MKNRRTILSLMMVFIYVHSFAHGSLPHNNCDNHQSQGLLHEHQSNDTEASQKLICSSKGVIHSFVHFIESLAHNQFAHDEPAVYESNGTSFHYLDVVFNLADNENQFVFTNPTKTYYTRSWYSDFHLLHTPLRGPPANV